MRLLNVVLYDATGETPLAYAGNHLRKMERTVSLSSEPTLTASVPFGAREAGLYTDRVLLETDYGSQQEWWRLSKVSEFRGNLDRDTSLFFRARWADLKSSVAEQRLASGEPLLRFAATDITVQDSLEQILSDTWQCPSLYVAGSVLEPLASRKVFFEEIGATHWGLLRTLAKEVNAEVEVSWTGTAYEVVVVDQVGRSDGPMITMNPLNAGIPYQELRRTSDTSRYVSRIYPVIEQQGSVVTLAGLWWPISSATGGGSSTTVELDFEPLWDALPLAGLTAEGDSGTVYTIDSTSAPNELVLSGDATGESRLRFCTSEGDPLTYVPDQQAEYEQGIASEVKRYQVAPRENLLERFGISPTGDGSDAEIVGSGDTLLGYTLGGFTPVSPGPLKLQVFAREAVSDIRIDAITLTPSEAPIPYSPLMGPRALWHEASKDILQRGGIQPDRFSGETLNLASVLMEGPTLGLGDSITIEVVNPTRGPVRIETRVQEIVEQLSVGKEALTQRVKASPPKRGVTDDLERLLR